MFTPPKHEDQALGLPLGIAARLKLEASRSPLSETEIVIEALRAYFSRAGALRAQASVALPAANRQAAPGDGFTRS